MNGPAKTGLKGSGFNRERGIATVSRRATRRALEVPALDLGPEQARAVQQGRVLTGLAFHDGLYCARLGTVPVALVELSGGNARVVRGFNLNDVAE